jgi:hypothetical protein
MIVACGFDHAGYILRERLLDVITSAGHEVLDFGTDRPERRAGDHRLRIRRRRVGRRRQDPRSPGRDHP